MKQLAFKEEGKCIDILVFLLLHLFFGGRKNSQCEYRSTKKINNSNTE